jgi:hypothetical protein
MLAIFGRKVVYFDGATFDGPVLLAAILDNCVFHFSSKLHFATTTAPFVGQDYILFHFCAALRGSWG